MSFMTRGKVMEFINRINISYSALTYAVNICQEKDRYRVGIAIEDEISYEEAKDFLLTLVKDYDNIEQAANSKNNFHIYFKNGSLIRFINTSGNARCQRYHLLIADNNVSEDVMRCIILPCWQPYYERYCVDKG